jgi:hypothetical protein
MPWEVPVNRDPCFALTRLVLDTMACLQAAQIELRHDRKVRAAIWLLTRIDVTDADMAPALLCNMDRSLRELEHEFRLYDRPFSAKKVHNVWEQVRSLRQLRHRARAAPPRQPPGLQSAAPQYTPGIQRFTRAL